MTLYEILAFIITPILGLLEPYVQQLTQYLTSSALHRKIVKVLIGLAVLVLLVGVSFAAYLSFYWIYIPQRGHVGQVHLQYDRPKAPGIIGAGPVAEVDFSRGGRYGQFLRADQAYDISVNLAVPTSEKNVAIGNFMVVVTLLRADGKTIMTSSRPAILTYQSQPLRLMRTAWKAVPLVLDWSKEDQVIRVPLIENYVEDAANPVSRAYVEISSPDLQVYRSTIHIDAHFHGLRFFMYYYKVSTALVFMSVFIFWEIIFSVVTWQVLAGWFGADAEALAIAHQIHPHRETRPGQQQLRAPTSYLAPPTAPRAQLQSLAPSPRQPQLQEDQHQRQQRLDESESDEEHELLVGEGSNKGDLLFDHDEMEDDEEEEEEDQDLEHLNQTFADEAVVPERASESTSQRMAPTSRSTRTLETAQRHGNSPSDDGASSSSSQRTGRTGLTSNLSMSSSSGVPPPPPPSELSERSSGYLTSRNRNRTAVESEYTEDEDLDDVTFDEDDFSEAALLQGRSGSIRSRTTNTRQASSSSQNAAHESSGRSTGRSGP